PRGREHDRAHTEAFGCPGRGCAVVARRGGDDGLGAVALVFLEGRQRSAPLEGAELVGVLPLEEEPAAEKVRFFEGCRNHANTRPGLSRRAASGRPASSMTLRLTWGSITGEPLPERRRSGPQASAVSRSARAA